MDDERINVALRDATDTRNVTIGAGVLLSVDDVFGQSFGDQPAVVIADGNTFAVAGKEVQQRLQAAGRTLVDPYIFPGQPTLYADYRNIVALAGVLRVHEAIPVAVGSGTLNDIVKRAAYECDRPYMVVATAASMDGYTAFGASITKEGYKQTMSCPAPKAVLADLVVLVHAPPKMTASGYADLLGKVTAGAGRRWSKQCEQRTRPRGWSRTLSPRASPNTLAPISLRNGSLSSVSDGRSNASGWRDSCCRLSTCGRCCRPPGVPPARPRLGWAGRSSRQRTPERR